MKKVLALLLLIAASLAYGQTPATLGNVGVLLDQTFSAGTFLLPPIPVSSGQYAGMNFFKVEYTPLTAGTITSCTLAINSDLTGVAITSQDCSNEGSAANGPIIANNILIQANVQGVGLVRVRVLAAMSNLSGGGGGGGGVSSVGLSLPAGLFSVGGSPVTGSGTLTASFVTISAHLFLGNNTSSPAMAGLVQPGFSDLTGSATIGQLPFTYTTTNGATKLATASVFSGLTGAGVCLDNAQNLTTNGCSGSMVYPSAGVPLSTGTSWSASYTVGTAANNLVQLNSSAQLPAVSAALLTSFPTFNQNTTGTAGGLSAAIAESLVTNLTTDLAARALTATTINGHALSGSFVISASDLTTGVLPHAQLPALVSGDIPNNTATTTGNAGGLSVGGTIAGLSDGCLHTVSNVVQSTGSSCGGAGGMIYPSGNGIAVVTGGVAWGTTLAAPTGAIVGAGQANTFTTGSQSFASATMVLPSSAAYAPTLAGTFGYDTTNNRAVLGNGTNTSILTWITTAPSSLNLAEFSGTLGLMIDSNVPAANVVTQASNGAANQIASYSTTNKVLVPVTTLPTAAEPAHTGDATNTAGSLAMTVSKINGTVFSGTINDVIAFGTGGNTSFDTNIVYTNLTTQTTSGAANQVCTYTTTNKVCVPASVANAALANSTIGINGTSNQITSTTTNPALGASTTLAIANPFTFPGKFSTIAGTTSSASYNVPSGVAPTSPVSGDTWNLSGIRQWYDGTHTNSAVTIQSAASAGSCAQFSGTAGLLVSIACGNVAISGLPVSGQMAQWTSGTQIQGVSVTGSGLAVLQTSPTLITPNVGVATATTVNGLTLTALTTGFSVAGGTTSKTLTVDATVSISALATLNSPAFTGTVTGINATMVGLGSVTNDLQTKASIMPNTAPGSGFIPVGNGSGYTSFAITVDSSISSVGVMHNIGLFFSGTDIQLGTAPTNGQCLTYNGTNIAGGSCGGGSSTIANAAQYAMPYYSATGSSNSISGVAAPTTPNGIAQIFTSTPSAGAATIGVWAVPGVANDAQTGTSYTIPITDDVHFVTGNNASATAWTGFALGTNFYAFSFENLGAGLITYTPASGSVNGNSTQIIPQNWFGFHYTDNTNTFMPVMPTLSAFANTSAGQAMAFNSATGAFSAVSVGVTSVATSSPLSGGTITSTGTLSCPTCVVASSPGAGIAHFAGATQTVTSSSVSLTADVSGVLPLANITQLFVPNSQSATYTAQVTDFADCKTIVLPSGTFTLTLTPSGSQPPAGQCIYILNYGSGTVTVARNGQNINGAASNLTLSAGSASAPTGMRVVSDGTNYYAQPIGGASGGSGVASFSGDGALLSNSGSTGTVTATLTAAGAFTVWGNPSGTSGAPSYTGTPSVTSVTLNGSTSGSCALSVTATAGTLNLCAGATVTSAGLLTIGSGLTLSGTSGANTTISTSTANANLLLSPNGTGAVIFNDGSVTNAAIQFAGGTAGAGIAQISAAGFGFTNGTHYFIDLQLSSATERNGGAFCFSNSTNDASQAQLACLTSPGTTATAQMILSSGTGGDTTVPTAFALIRASGCASCAANLSGSDLQLGGGPGDGNSSPSRTILLGPAYSSTSGTTVQTLVTRSQWGNAKAVSNTTATATTVVTPVIGTSLGSAGGTLFYDIKISDGTDVCVLTGSLNWNLVVKSGTYTGNTSGPLNETKVQSASSCGTFSTTWAWSSNSLQVTPTFSTMSPTTAYITWNTTSQGDVSLP